MIIVVDLGNSRLKWNALADMSGGFLYSTQSEEWNEQALGRLFQSQWMQLSSEITNMVVSNVAGQAMGNILRRWSELNIKHLPSFVQSEATYNHIKNGYQEPKTLGVDRWLAVIGAHYRFPEHHVIVVDCGTATTVDAISVTGQHMAGPIIAGEKILTSALLQFTAGIFFENQDSNVPAIVTNTRDAALQGARLASIHGTKQAVVEMAEKLGDGTSLKVIVTGGRAADLIPELDMFDVTHFPDLVLNGLSIVARDSVKPGKS